MPNRAGGEEYTSLAVVGDVFLFLVGCFAWSGFSVARTIVERSRRISHLTFVTAGEGGTSRDKRTGWTWNRFGRSRMGKIAFSTTGK